MRWDVLLSEQGQRELEKSLFTSNDFVKAGTCATVLAACLVWECAEAETILILGDDALAVQAPLHIETTLNFWTSMRIFAKRSSVCPALPSASARKCLDHALRLGACFTCWLPTPSQESRLQLPVSTDHRFQNVAPYRRKVLQVQQPLHLVKLCKEGNIVLGAALLPYVSCQSCPASTISATGSILLLFLPVLHQAGVCSRILRCGRRAEPC